MVYTHKQTTPTKKEQTTKALCQYNFLTLTWALFFFFNTANWLFDSSNVDVSSFTKTKNKYFKKR